MEPEPSIGEIIAIIILFFFFVVVAVSFFVGIFIIQVEHMFSLVFKRPFYVHLYAFPKRLDEKQLYILRQHASFYNRLTPRRKRYFEHRLYRVMNTYQFIGRDITVTDEMKVRIGATFVMLTFGMRNYLVSIIDKIIIYPSVYLSVMTNEYHKGEFNPGLRAAVFSWEDFISGHENNTDNLNLGIHEFAHVLHYHGKRSSDISAGIFAMNYDRICVEVNHPTNKKKLLDSDYFRGYAFTNHFEFLAVIMEHYFETPDQFKSAFPQLYANVAKMLNHKHVNTQLTSTL